MPSFRRVTEECERTLQPCTRDKVPFADRKPVFSVFFGAAGFCVLIITGLGA